MRHVGCWLAAVTVGVLTGCDSASVAVPSPAPTRACPDPDGAVAAFTGSDLGVGPPYESPESPPGPDVWTMTAGREVTQITDDHRSRDPWLSRDGERLYFTRADRVGSGSSGDPAPS